MISIQTTHRLLLAGAVGLFGSGSAWAAGCGDALPAFQAAMQANTAEALSDYLAANAPCFEAPARARLDALGGTPVAAPAPAPAAIPQSPVPPQGAAAAIPVFPAPAPAAPQVQPPAGQIPVFTPQAAAPQQMQPQQPPAVPSAVPGIQPVEDAGIEEDYEVTLLRAEPPTDEATEAALQLGSAEVREIQSRLASIDFDPNGVDGQIGPGTRQAIVSWQESMALVGTGFLSAGQLSWLRSYSEDSLLEWLEDPDNKADFDGISAAPAKAKPSAAKPKKKKKKKKVKICKRNALGMLYDCRTGYR